MLLFPCALAAAALLADVQLQSERITLGAVVQRMPEPWASVDLGAAPAPLQSRWVLAQQVHAAVLAAHLGRAPVPVPRRTRVVRSGQVLSAPALRPLILQQVQDALPPNAAVRSLVIHSGAVLPEGPVNLHVVWSTPAHAGKQMVMAHLETPSDDIRMVPVTLDLHVPQVRSNTIITRGASVHAVLTLGNVQVQQAAVAQGTGALGDMITLLPEGGSRMLRGRVLDEHTVEVQP